MKRLAVLSVSALALSGMAQNPGPLSLEKVLEAAFQGNPTLQSAQVALQNAEIQLKAKEQDPTTLILDLTQARQAYALSQANLAYTRLQVLRDVVNAYLSLFENQQNIGVLKAQVALAERNLQVAKARQAAGNATSLDVARAQATLDTARQNLATAQGQTPILAAQLAVLLGLSDLGPTPLAPPPEPPRLQVDLETLSRGVLEKLPQVLQAQQAVAYNELQVKLYDNDYTPALALKTAQLSLQNNRKALSVAEQNALTSLKNAYQAAQAAYGAIALAQSSLENAKKVLEQDQAAYRAGTVSALQVETDQVSVLTAEYSLLQAKNAYWRALLALSLAAGEDLTGLQR
ncbi:TolC family protein [Thermus thalpophilus]|uniref:TolC family protein n=1 Tax=Thermus thalpophilus TaxID=2908147 RepID=UPI001FA9A19E